MCGQKRRIQYQRASPHRFCMCARRRTQFDKTRRTISKQCVHLTYI
jgi:hypothetical protein